MKNFISGNLILKIVSALLAILTWVYIDREIARIKEKEKVTLIWDKELNLEVRELPIRPNIKGVPPRGYRLVEARLSVNPPQCKVVGKKEVLDSIEYVETEPVDVRKINKTAVIKISLHPVSNLIIPEGEVEVVVPVEKNR
jgi:YbbR domain-containing protein